MHSLTFYHNHKVPTFIIKLDLTAFILLSARRAQPECPKLFIASLASEIDTRAAMHCHSFK